MNLLAVVSTQLLLLFLGPASQRLFDIPRGVFTAYHKADLAGRVGGDGGVGVFGHGEDFSTGGLKLSDEFKVEPLIFACSGTSC